MMLLNLYSINKALRLAGNESGWDKAMIAARGIISD